MDECSVLVRALRDGFAGLCGFRPVPDSRHLLAALSLTELTGISDRLECANPGSGLCNAVTSRRRRGIRIVTARSEDGAGQTALQQDPPPLIVDDSYVRSESRRGARPE